MTSIPGTKRFFLADLPRTLFPLNTDAVLVENFANELHEFVYTQVFAAGEGRQRFIAQQQVFADNARRHLRRTVKLDPIAAWYIYDLAFKNRQHFRPPESSRRKHFGYRFEEGVPVDGRRAYGEFLSDYRALKGKYKYRVSFDVASYFNSIYHHDIVSWFSERVSGDDKDRVQLGKFSRRSIAGGASVSCLRESIHAR